MPRGVKRKEPYHQTHGFEVEDPYPQHRKLHPHTESNWQIREFVFWLRTRGSADLTDLKFDDINDLILQFRGVDLLEYRAEVAQMRSRYRWMWEKIKPEPAQAQTIPEPAEVVEPEADPLRDLLDKVRRSRDV